MVESLLHKITSGHCTYIYNVLYYATCISTPPITCYMLHYNAVFNIHMGNTATYEITDKYLFQSNMYMYIYIFCIILCNYIIYKIYNIVYNTIILRNYIHSVQHLYIPIYNIIYIYICTYIRIHMSQYPFIRYIIHMLRTIHKHVTHICTYAL